MILGRGFTDDNMNCFTSNVFMLLCMNYFDKLQAKRYKFEVYLRMKNERESYFPFFIQILYTYELRTSKTIV
jgi:hypothetical protein